jgi:hypothetical protein
VDCKREPLVRSVSLMARQPARLKVRSAWAVTCDTPQEAARPRSDPCCTRHAGDVGEALSNPKGQASNPSNQLCRPTGNNRRPSLIIFSCSSTRAIAAWCISCMSRLTYSGKGPSDSMCFGIADCTFPNRGDVFVAIASPKYFAARRRFDR